MELYCESLETHSIQHYSEQHIQVNHQQCALPVLLTATQLLSLPLALQDLQAVDDVIQNLTPKPTILIIGHPTPHAIPPIHLHAFLQQGIGVEHMTLGAACRTFNILLGEKRPVAGLFML